MTATSSTDVPPTTISEQTIALLKTVNVSTLTNCLLRRGFRNQFLHGVAPLDPALPNMVGPAFTLRFIPSREDLDTMANYQLDTHVQRRAIEECPSGAVLVVDSRGDSRAASAGDLLIARLKARGCAGIVTDGGYRDLPGIRRTGLPSYQAQTASPATPITLHPADLNLPIGCAGVAVYPGDIVVGDAEGVVIVPAHVAAEVAEEAAAVVAYEEFAEEKINEGRSIFGLFPATEASRREYDAWKATRS
ncbi:ribonuclease activity regulator RraA [Ancylobacter sp. WKF20]|uniref:ribonuclease activity regulator RraA n=1 Tax=Ancylobacter sp. WKF20 TaxID=3039801 RepID=UPI002434658A|nr:ribonuclease activity regulator RraA [Ancylobacter sp. WKF20]WGD29747.1 ribonuclease activity regulator RraA [Ancylobacter sp. WKF20]